MDKINEYVTGLGLPILLFVAGIFLFSALGKYIFSPGAFKKLFSGDKSSKSSFSALCLALAGTLGVGNITGTAAAIAVGGAGTVFWMWVCAVISSVLKYSETVLAISYREKTPDGKHRGGAYHYIKNGLKSPFWAIIFSVVCLITSLTMGNMTQVRAATDAIDFLPSAALGATFFVTVLLITLGGGKRISAFSVKVVPPLCLVYSLSALAVIIMNADKLGEVTAFIISEAFTPRAGGVGIAAYLCFPALRLGITRGIMSSEAGCGSAPTAHAQAETDDPVKQGLFGMIEVICDTLVLCTLTAYAVLLSGVPLSGEATDIALSAFSSVLGEPIRILLSIAIFFFALAAVSCWAFYGQESLINLGLGRRALRAYGIIYAFFAFTSCVIPESSRWELSDLSVALMALINITVLLLLSPRVIKITKRSLSKSTLYPF